MQRQRRRTQGIRRKAPDPGLYHPSRPGMFRRTTRPGPELCGHARSPHTQFHGPRGGPHHQRWFSLRRSHHGTHERFRSGRQEGRRAGRRRNHPRRRSSHGKSQANRTQLFCSFHRKELFANDERGVLQGRKHCPRNVGMVAEEGRIARTVPHYHSQVQHRNIHKDRRERSRTDSRPKTPVGPERHPSYGPRTPEGRPNRRRHLYHRCRYPPDGCRPAHHVDATATNAEQWFPGNHGCFPRILHRSEAGKRQKDLCFRRRGWFLQHDLYGAQDRRRAGHPHQDLASGQREPDDGRILAASLPRRPKARRPEPKPRLLDPGVGLWHPSHDRRHRGRARGEDARVPL
mmetsp:Transcript_1343/g.3310  ORF Transcript_1343/g.3310 Transcript_1343/m.3310 type:complete len:345 (+) Transcript_1343:546-1580(+)